MSGQPAGPRPDTGAARLPTLPFVWAAIAIALTGGFGLGAALLLGPALGAPVGAWGRAAAQAHGHAQIVGWGGLMILGIGLHILPRLRGAPLARPGWRPWALGLLTTGLGLRLLGQPLAAALAPAPPAALAAWLGLALGGLLELTGAGLALAMLLATHRQGPPVGERPAVGQVLPPLALGLTSLLLMLLLNAGLGARAALQGAAVLPEAGNRLAGEIGLFGFLAPVCLGVAARFLPLHLGLRPAAPRGLLLATGLLAAGLAGLLAAGWWPGLRPAGEAALGLGLLAGLWAIGRRPDGSPLGLLRPPPPRAPLPPAARAANRLVRIDHAWLLLAAGLLLVGAAAPAGWAPPPDVVRHALGAGHVSLLILGMGALLLPGLLGRRGAPTGPVRAALWLGTLAAAARVAPGLAAWLAPGLLPAPLPALLLATAGLLGLAEPLCLALIVRGEGRPRRPVTPAAPGSPGAG